LFKSPNLTSTLYFVGFSGETFPTGALCAARVDCPRPQLQRFGRPHPDNFRSPKHPEAFPRTNLKRFEGRWHPRKPPRHYRRIPFAEAARRSHLGRNHPLNRRSTGARQLRQRTLLRKVFVSQRRKVRHPQHHERSPRCDCESPRNGHGCSALRTRPPAPRRPRRPARVHYLITAR
jgi:hypothetical protein